MQQCLEHVAGTTVAVCGHCTLLLQYMTNLIFQCHIYMFPVHRVQMDFVKHLAVIIGPVQHPGTRALISLVYSKLT